jgi:hypothetical protein
MDLHDNGAMMKYLIRDRDTTFTRAFNAIVIGENITIITTSLCAPRMNSIMQSCQRATGPHTHLEPPAPTTCAP